jgi:hypothetical protein
MKHEIEHPLKPDAGTPFIIRAHHLSHYRFLVKPNHENWHSRNIRLPLSPKEVAENKIRKDVEADTRSGYSQDVLGPSTESADKFTKKIEVIFDRFLILPDKHPVEIAEEIPDDICKACAVGDHCKTSPPRGSGENLNFLEKSIEYFYSTFILPRGHDQLVLNYFIKTARQLKLPSPSISKEKIIYSDTKKSRIVRKAKTTIGAVKLFLAEL